MPTPDVLAPEEENLMFPYTQVPNKVEPFFAKLRQVGIPDQVTQTWLAKVGFKSSNDRTLLRILHFLGFVDSASCPTQLWRAYRSANGGSTLARAIQQSYADLYETYPDAQAMPEDDLRDFMRGSSDAADGTVARMVSTFRAIASLADFTSVSAESNQQKAPDAVSGDSPSSSKAHLITNGVGPKQPASLAIHLHFSADSDPDLVEKALKPLLPQLASSTLTINSDLAE